MSQKILPVTYPPLTTFTGYADALAILLSYEHTYDWIYSHFMQIYATQIMIEDIEKAYPTSGFAGSFFGDFDNRRLTYTISDGMFLDREKNPFLNIFEIPNDIITAYDSSFISIIKHILDNSMYIYAYADASKIKMYNIDEEYGHPIFIYGYNDDEKEIYFADFLYKSKYSFLKCSYDEIEEAFQNIKNLFIPMVKSISAIQVVTSGSFTFDFSYIRDTIYEYIYPDEKMAEKFTKYSSSFFGPIYWKTKAHIGSDIYSFLSNFINISLEFYEGNIDLRLYHALLDHKEMMINRFVYFMKKGYLGPEKADYIKEYEKVRNNAMEIRNLIMKFKMKKDEKVLDKVHTLLEETKELENKQLKKIFDIS